MNNIDCFIGQIREGISVLKTLSKDDFRVSAVRQGIRRQIQYLTEIEEKFLYSEKAYDLAKKTGLDIQTISRKGGTNRVGGEKNKPALIPEHTTPIKVVIDRMIEEPLENIRQILENYSPICWVTREEDDSLRKLGFSQVRPNGWQNCYEQAGIKIKNLVI